MADTEWFLRDRFGMFIHWGPYSVAGRGEWLRSESRMTVGEYQAYVDAFDAADCDPSAWARTAKNCGMKYAVFTAKHHDGFCLFDSAATSYTSMRSACRRDIVREYVDALRAEDLKVGLYYSLVDWHHPDYPHCGDPFHPMRGDPSHEDGRRDFSRYLEYMHEQIKELCSNYGRIDILWMDFSYPGKSGEDWEATKLVRMIRALQPDCLINSRLAASGENLGPLLSKEECAYSGDFLTPELTIPPYALSDRCGKPLPWEVCMSINNSWGYRPFDLDYKDSATIVRSLVECVGKAGNLILNVSPDACGALDRRTQDILAEVGQWMRRNGESVYGCGPAGLPPQSLQLTRRGKVLYAHCTQRPTGPLPVLGLRPEQVQSARFLADGKAVGLARGWLCGLYPETAFFVLSGKENESRELLDPVDTVIEIRLGAPLNAVP